MKLYSIMIRGNNTSKEIPIGPGTMGGDHLWPIAIGLCCWLALVIEMVVRAVEGVGK